MARVDGVLLQELVETAIERPIRVRAPITQFGDDLGDELFELLFRLVFGRCGQPIPDRFERALVQTIFV